MTFEEMYKDYVFSRDQVLVEVFETGFITYKQQTEDTVYAIDLYSSPEARGQGTTLKHYNHFEEKIKKEGFKYMITSVDFGDSNSTTMLSYMIKSGYKIYSADSTLLYVRKEL